VIVPCVHAALGDGLNFGLAEVFGFEYNALAALIPGELIGGYAIARVRSVMQGSSTLVPLLRFRTTIDYSETRRIPQ
jgi:hypothetical protein